VYRIAERRGARVLIVRAVAPDQVVDTSRELKPALDQITAFLEDER
jgi:hypothetical protein